MINFKNRDEVLPSALTLLSILLMTGALLFILLVHPPKLADIEQQHKNARRHINSDTLTATIRARDAEKAAAPRLWPGDPRSVTSTVLAQLTDKSRQEGVTLTSFRPQRGQVIEDVGELRFAAQLSGNYLKVRNVLASFDAKDGKTALRSVDMSSGAKDNVVTATIGLSAYLPATETTITTITSGGGGNG